jgi:hypothetical protein
MFFSSPPRPDRLWGPPRGISPGVKRPGREVEHSLPSSTEVRILGAMTPLPQTSGLNVLVVFVLL